LLNQNASHCFMTHSEQLCGPNLYYELQVEKHWVSECMFCCIFFSVLHCP